MTNPAKLSIEDAYSIALNPDLDYLSQLQPLARDGELANKLTTNKVLFKLCMIVDAQEKEIKSLKDNHVFLAKQISSLLEKKVNPTTPLGG